MTDIWVICEIHHFDDHGHIVRSEMYWDLDGLLAEAGVLPPLGTTTAA